MSGVGAGPGSSFSEVSVSNQRSVGKTDRRRKVHRPHIALTGKLAKINGGVGSSQKPVKGGGSGPGRMTDPQDSVGGKRLKIVTSNAPVLSAKLKPKHTKKAIYKRD